MLPQLKVKYNFFCWRRWLFTCFLALIANQYSFPAGIVSTAGVWVPKDTLPAVVKDTLPLVADTIPFKMAKDSIDEPVKYSADDSVVVDLRTEKIFLYNQGKIDYKDIQLKSAVIQVDQNTQVLTAFPVLDSANRSCT